MKKDENKSLSEEYYRSLDEFVHLCHSLVDRGLPYLAVILCHELFRFTYPVEPSINFKHEKPVKYIYEHINKLIKAAREYELSVIPYQFDLTENIGAKPDDGEALEVETSNVYTELWNQFKTETISAESVSLLKKRIPEDVIRDKIIGKSVLDMGCGSGRYSIALSSVGASHVTAVDVQSKSFAAAEKIALDKNMAIEFREEHVHRLSFSEERFDFVFCNGVLHHTDSIEAGLKEIWRVLKKDGTAFIFLYGAGGIFWTTRSALRDVFAKIPASYTQKALDLIGMPANRFIFMDTWYVPIETHTDTGDLHGMLDSIGFKYKKIVGTSPFDQDKAVDDDGDGAVEMWGNGEHRYLMEKI